MNDRHWYGQRVLVTGATGLLGQWVVRGLLGAGAKVVCLTRNWQAMDGVLRRELEGKITPAEGDIRNQDFLLRTIGEHEVDTVFHLAAQTIVGNANRDPVSTFATNIGGTWGLLEACRLSQRVKAVLIASSDKAYGDQTILPYTEEMPLEGRAPYECSKSCADLIAQSYARTYGLPVVITRCGNFYGGGDLNWNRIVPGTIRSVIEGEAPEIRSDGTFLRDYFYVEDGAAACLLAAERVAEDPGLHGLAFNFSNELRVTVIDLVKRILKRMNSGLRPVVRNEAKQEIRDQYLSAARARAMLGWSPRFTLDEGLDRTVEWYTRYFAGLKSAAAYRTA